MAGDTLFKAPPEYRGPAEVTADTLLFPEGMAFFCHVPQNPFLRR